jgi:uncharacterized protein (DUF305 family)
VKPLAVATLLVLFAASCQAGRPGGTPVLVQPGAPGQESHRITAEAAVSGPAVAVTAADVSFMQRMIGHHAQALEMTALLPSRTARPDMRLLARRIELSQADEIEWMERWLEVRGQAAPDAHAHHAAGAALMPGMLTPEELTRLAEAAGSDFDRLFLEFMIKHHEGALIMVSDLFMREGAGQDTEVFAFASDVDADQRIEIDRMMTLLRELMK